MLNKNFLLHLTLIDGIGPSIIYKIAQIILRKDCEGHQRSGVYTSDLYHLSAFDWMNYYNIPENAATKLVAGLSDTTLLEKELSLIEEHKIQWITIEDESYPQLLKEIHFPPIVLYSIGASWQEIGKCVAVVGSRKADDYGKHIVSSMVPDLVAAGYTIVSGGALGIDTMAHQAALACGGKTVAILGSGLLKLYPSSNKKLFAAIVENGGIVASSYPLNMEALPHNFPARNRIVTGLSKGCLVVQAAQKSGALISAHCAMEQGREVFAVPGKFDDALSAGCHEIIQQGAKLVMQSADILSEFGEIVQIRSANSERVQKVALEQKKLFVADAIAPRPLVLSLSKDIFERSKEKYSETQQKIVAACKQPISLDDISIKTALPFELLQSELFALQIEGVVSQDFMGMWSAQL